MLNLVCHLLVVYEPVKWSTRDEGGWMAGCECARSPSPRTDIPSRFVTKIEYQVLSFQSHSWNLLLTHDWLKVSHLEMTPAYMWVKMRQQRRCKMCEGVYRVLCSQYGTMGVAKWEIMKRFILLWWSILSISINNSDLIVIDIQAKRDEFSYFQLSKNLHKNLILIWLNIQNV